MLLLVLCGPGLCASAAEPAPAPAAAEGAPTSADVLLPETDSDVVALLSHLTRAQHEVVLATHGPVRCCACAKLQYLAWQGVPDTRARGAQNSLHAALSFAATTAQEQFTNWYLQFQNEPPLAFDLAYNFVQNFSAAVNAVRSWPNSRPGQRHLHLSAAALSVVCMPAESAAAPPAGSA